jgi:hypothetical protein
MNRYFLLLTMFILLSISISSQDFELEQESSEIPKEADNSQEDTVPEQEVAPPKERITKKETISNSVHSKEEIENTELSIEIVSDFIFRGQSFGGEVASQRNNSSYRSYTDAWAIQPYLVYKTPLQGFQLLFWGNLFLQHNSDRDSDRYLQNGPGQRNLGEELQRQYNQTGRIPLDTELDLLRANLYKEKNGLHRQNGVFLGGYYEWNTKFGEWTVGTWFWNNSNKAARFTWQEYFVWYKPKILPFLNPMFSAYFNASSDNGGDNSNPSGITNGQNYFSLDLNHEFGEGKFFRFIPSLHLGYVINNDNVNNKSGISNITTELKFAFGKFYTTANWIHRPDVTLFDVYDSNNLDGRTPNPARSSGIYNVYETEIIRRFTPEAAEYVNAQIRGQAIVNNLLYFAFGYETKF